jgi:hypothetical protein
LFWKYSISSSAGSRSGFRYESGSRSSYGSDRGLDPDSVMYLVMNLALVPDPVPNTVTDPVPVDTVLDKFMDPNTNLEL